MGGARELATRVAKPRDGEDPRHDPARTFAQISRAVRCTLALETRIDVQILAMRNSEVVPAMAASAAIAPTPATAWPEFDEPAEVSLSPYRSQVRSAVWDAINLEIRVHEEAKGVLDRLHENLVERENYDSLLYRPWREAVVAICADLGLDPDWSRWTDEGGSNREPHASGYYWETFWKYCPDQAAERRRRRSETSDHRREGDGSKAFYHPPTPSSRTQ